MKNSETPRKNKEKHGKNTEKHKKRQKNVAKHSFSIFSRGAPAAVKSPSAEGSALHYPGNPSRSPPQVHVRFPVAPWSPAGASAMVGDLDGEVRCAPRLPCVPMADGVVEGLDPRECWIG